MSIQIPELSSETAKNETVEAIQKAKKRITEFFDYVNDKRPSIADICREYNFDEINLKKKNKQ